MSDISIEFGPLELIALVFLMGWPGFLIGAAIGALTWKRRRAIGAGVGALLGAFVWAGIRFTLI